MKTVSARKKEQWVRISWRGDLLNQSEFGQVCVLWMTSVKHLWCAKNTPCLSVHEIFESTVCSVNCKWHKRRIRHWFCPGRLAEVALARASPAQLQNRVHGLSQGLGFVLQMYMHSLVILVLAFCMLRTISWKNRRNWRSVGGNVKSQVEDPGSPPVMVSGAHSAFAQRRLSL